MREFAPTYSTHGHGRKTHLCIIGETGALCGIQDRHPDLLFDTGKGMALTTENVADYLNPDTADVCCITCKRKLRKMNPTSHGAGVSGE